MDYYKILGLNTNATKDEIKQAFRSIAKKFHPDKHSSSPKSVQHGAALKFKQASEAYQVLVDDRKRADYNNNYYYSNRGSSSSSSYSGGSGYGNYGYGYTYDNRRNNKSSSGYDYYYYYYGNGNRKATVSKLQTVVAYLNSRAFLLNVAFAGALLSGLAVVEIGRDAIWKRQNPEII